MGSTTGYSSAYNNQDPGIWFDNYEMAHFRFIGDVNYLPYGRSYLEPARKLFKQYTLIEDAMLIHRIVRAPDKRAYYVNVGAIPPAEVENYMQRMMSKMKKTPLVDPQTGQYNMKYNVQNMLEDYFVPTRGSGDTTRIDTIPGLQYNGIEDVAYFREKLFAALKIPKAFMGYEKDLCIVPETRIPLLNGITKTAAELIIDFENGIDNYTYSIDESTKNIVPGKILWAGYTRKNADLIRVRLDNDKYIDCTPDHNFMTRDGQWIEAQNLQAGQPLMPIYFEETSKGYTAVYNPGDGKYKEVHRLIPEYYGSIKKGLGKVVHHIDFDKKNNYVYANHKVKSIEFLDYKKDTCDLHIEDHHNFATEAGVIIHNSGKATLAAEDIRFARTVERIQRIIVSELKKIALVHLYANGYTDESASNFQLALTGPSIIYDQERIAMFKEKIDLMNQATSTAGLPRDYIWKNIFRISEDEFGELDDMIVEDQKRKFRFGQIETEGNDPAETGQAFGTPHQLASIYGGKGDGTLDVPSGYNEKNANEPNKIPGRPQKYKSTYGTDDSPFGRDRLGAYDLKANAETGEDSFKPKFKGGPLNLEGRNETLSIYLKNQSDLKKMFAKKIKLFENSIVLDESNIIEDLEK
jgi:hypothetical protein